MTAPDRCPGCGNREATHAMQWPALRLCAVCWADVILAIKDGRTTTEVDQ